MHAKHINCYSLFASVAAVAFAWSAWAQDAAPESELERELPTPGATLLEQIAPCVRGNEIPEMGGVPAVPSAVDCGELIVPPPGVDPEITIAPPQPDTGTMPVLPPSSIEPQRP
jgi:hypothetical protein